MKFRPGQLCNESTTRLELYLHQKYNVKDYYVDNQFSNENALLRIHNAVVKAINDNSRLPRTIIIIPGVEFFKSLDHVDYGVSMIIGKCMDWLITNIECLIRTRKMDLFHVRQGAVEKLEPKIIWVSMITTGQRNFQPLVGKFNAILEQSLFQAGCGFFLKSMNFHPSLWDRNNTLNHDGRIHYWRHISKILKGFDEQVEDFDLLPKNVFSQQDQRYKHSRQN